MRDLEEGHVFAQLWVEGTEKVGLGDFKKILCSVTLAELVGGITVACKAGIPTPLLQK